MTEENKRAQWLKAGWKRGSFVDLLSHPDLIQTLPKKLQEAILHKEQVFLIPLLYDCSLIEECFIREPWVQVLICWPSDKKSGDGNFKYGKNPRKIHFPINIDGNEVYIHAEAIGFFQFDREELLKASPLDNTSWPAKGLPQLLNWVAERYNQPTFPDEWNVRMDTKKKNLGKLWKKAGFINSCSGLYLNITPFDEVLDTEDYTLEAYFVVSSTLTGKEHREFVKQHEEDLKQTLHSIIKAIPNITINFIDTIKEDQFTKAMERDFQRWQLEHLSYKNLDTAPLPAELDIKK